MSTLQDWLSTTHGPDLVAGTNLYQETSPDAWHSAKPSSQPVKDRNPLASRHPNPVSATLAVVSQDALLYIVIILNNNKKLILTNFFAQLLLLYYIITVVSLIVK
jgi:hypothetical protein